MNEHNHFNAGSRELILLGCAFLAVFFVSFLFLSIVGFVPEGQTAHTTQTETSTPQTVVDSTRFEKPTRVIIDKIGVDMPIGNPQTTDAAVLDNALLSGAVRYPGSGLLGEEANMFLFGHSSYLPVVHNPAFRAFNDIQKLKAGDLIRVQSATKEEVYRVSTVQKMNASDAFVSLEKGTKMLTLSTCDSFGKPSERFVVEAAFVGSSTL